MNGKKIRLITTGVVMLLLLINGFADAAGNDITIGGLYPGGDWQSQAPEILAGWELAIDDMNAYYSSARIPINLHLLTADAGDSGTTARKAAEDLFTKGVNLFVGPFFSAETEGLSDYLKEEQILSIGASSSVNLSLQGDLIFRLVPDNTAKIHALQTYWKFKYDSTPVIIPISRDDCINDTDCVDDVASLIQQDSDRWSSAIRYTANTTDFSETLTTLVNQVKKAKATYPDVPIAVMIIGHDEIPLLLHQAETYPELANLIWCGLESDMNQDLLSDPDTVGFAEKTSYTIAAFAGTTENTAFADAIKQEIASRTGTPATIQGLIAYDQVLLAGMMIKDAQYLSADEYQQVIPQVAKFLNGATGSLVLDKNGDRESDQFMIWQIHKDETGTYQWMPVALAGDEYAVLFSQNP